MLDIINTRMIDRRITENKRIIFLSFPIVWNVWLLRRIAMRYNIGNNNCYARIDRAAVDHRWTIYPAGFRHVDCSRQSSYRAQPGRNCYVCHTVCLKAAGHRCGKKPEGGRLMKRCETYCFSKTRAS